ncbi:very short patch repair endonuclease [Microbacterium sp. NPDC058021]|uniref:very short patch repair endonuclease n=1 Tax=Microbacterium sp. NPDC058021 TaxID=3346306 RepID=UPI0036D78F4A
MADSWASSEGTRKSMLANKRRDTSTEIAVRRELHARGLRYRVDFAPLPGLRRRADVVFTRARVAVFIDGCFWHGCPIHGTAPKRNADYWGPKLAANVARDQDTDRRLADAGWRVLRFWEHEAPSAVADRAEHAVRRR